MRIRLKYVAVGILGVFALWVVGALQAANWFHPRITQAEVKRELRQGLPMGSTLEQAITFLGARGWIDPHDPQIHANRGIPSSDDFEAKDLTGQTLTAAIPDAYPGLLISGGIFMKFGFNAKGRLTRYSLDDIYTGP